MRLPHYECYYNLRCIMSSTPVAPPSSRDLTSLTGTECTCKRETFAAPCIPGFSHCLRYLQIWRENASRTTQTENSHMGGMCKISWEILSITFTKTKQQQQQQQNKQYVVGWAKDCLNFLGSECCQHCLPLSSQRPAPWVCCHVHGQPSLA